jgi:hypothetical protein
MAAGEIRDRHQLDGGDTERLQARQLRGDAGKAAACAGVEFVDDGLREGQAAPVWMSPVKILIDEEARIMDVAGLGVRGGVR